MASDFARAARRRPCAEAQANGLDSFSETGCEPRNVSVLGRIEIAFRCQISEPREICDARIIERVELELLHPERFADAVARDDQPAVERDPIGLGAARG